MRRPPFLCRSSSWLRRPRLTHGCGTTLLRPGNVVLEPVQVPTRQMRGSTCDGIEQRIEPFIVRLGEVVENVRHHGILRTGMADADPHPNVIVSDVRGDGLETIVPGVAATGFYPHLARLQVQLVVKYDDVGKIN